MADTKLLCAIGTVLLTCGLMCVAEAPVATGAQPKAISKNVQGPTPAPKRVRSGLLVLYDFSSISGPIVKDRSGLGRPVDLRITDATAVRRSQGSLEVHNATLIRSQQPASKIIQAVRRSGEITIEVWIRPKEINQDGPARILTLSKNSTQRNFTLGHDGDRFDVRLRTSITNDNGLPSLRSPSESLTTDVTHCVYTRDRNGRTRIYLSGEETEEEIMPGSTRTWHGHFRMALANELDASRPWLGTYYLVAIYGRDLLPQEVEQNFRAGPDSPTVLPQLGLVDESSQQFETHVAPILANNCLECHDSVSREGGLDLSRKVTALTGGDSGPAFVPNNVADSLLWQMVESDEMPKMREPLSAKEKSILQAWLLAGAAWSLDKVDPLLYTYGSDGTKNWVRRLTVSEYIETVRYTCGVEIADKAHQLLPSDVRADGFSNTAYNLNVDLEHVSAYTQLAQDIVAKMDVVSFAARFSQSQSHTDEKMLALIAAMGKWILRGPLEEHELTSYRGISTSVASAGGDFEEAVQYIVQAMLQSPRFIYRMENQRGDGTPWPISDYEMASRLSYILWGGPPDQELMSAANEGLLDRKGVQEQTKRMLADARAVEHSLRFVDQWLNLAQLDSLRPSETRFPCWNPQLAADMRHETLAFFKEVVWKQKRPLADLLNAQFTFLTPRLAQHYGLTVDELAPADPTHCEPQRYNLKSVPSRGGLLTQGSVLTVGGDEASMVSRGLFILHNLLRGAVWDPPPCVDTTPISTKAGLTQRGIAEARVANQACGGCHTKFEPLAYGLERFDGLGAFHEKDEHGNLLRDDGVILIPGERKPLSFGSSSELMTLLSSSSRVHESLVWKLTQFALGRPLVATDAAILEQIYRLAQQDGGTYLSAMEAIVMSDLVQLMQTEKDE